MEIQETPREAALLDAEGAARLLGISPRTVQTWVRQKRIPFIKLGSLTRFKAASLHEWLDAQEVKAVTADAAPVKGE